MKNIFITLVIAGNIFAANYLYYTYDFAPHIKALIAGIVLLADFIIYRLMTDK